MREDTTALGVLAGDRAWGDAGHPAALRPRGRWGAATATRLASRPRCTPLVRERGAPGPNKRPWGYNGLALGSPGEAAQ